MCVNHSASTGGKVEISFRFFNMNVYCVFSLESPHRGDSNEYTKYTMYKKRKENHTKLSQICSYGIFSNGFKNELEIAPLKFYCIVKASQYLQCCRTLFHNADRALFEKHHFDTKSRGVS